MEKITERVLRHPWIVIILVIISGIVLSYLGLKVQDDNSINIWLVENDPQLITYKEFLQKFGSEDYIVIAFKSDDIFTPEMMERIHEMSEKLSTIEHVAGVDSLADIYYPRKPPMEDFRWTVLYETDFFKHNLISEDGKVTAIICSLQTGIADPDKPEQIIDPAIRIQVYQEVQKVLKEYRDKGMHFYLAGQAVFNEQLNDISAKTPRIFQPAIVVLLIIIVFILYRSFIPVIIAILAFRISVGWTEGFFYLLGVKMNMITVVIFPLLIVITLSYCVHIFNHFYEFLNQGYDRKKAVIKSVGMVGAPCLLNSLTTAIGFSSLLASELRPIQELGLFASIGILLAVVVSLTFVPCALLVFKTKKQRPKTPPMETMFNTILRGISRTCVNRKWTIAVVSAVVIVVSVIFATRLRVETNSFKYFGKNTTLAQSYTFIENNLMGPDEIEVMLDVNPSADSVITVDTLKKMAAFQKYAEGLDEITNTISINDYLANLPVLTGTSELSLFLSGPKTGEELRQSIRNAPERLEEEMRKYVTPDMSSTRIVLRTRTLNSNRYQKLLDELDAYLQDHFTEDVTPVVTGTVPLINNMQNYLISSQVRSFAIALVIITLVMCIILRSWRMGLLSMIPNIVPIVFAVGFMGLVGINLDIATILIASIAIGIAVDDTIHFLYGFRREYSACNNVELAIKRTFPLCGKGIMFTSLITALSFGVLCISNFLPTFYFGVLMAITMVSALFGDLFLLPTILFIFKIRDRHKKAVTPPD